MLIEGGLIQHIGDPAEVGRRYLQMNFDESGEAAAAWPQSSEEVRILDARIEDASGVRLGNLEHGHKLRLRIDLEILADTLGLGVGLIIANADGIGVSEFGTGLTDDQGGLGSKLASGSRFAPR